jgi:hypothetical protein
MITKLLFTLVLLSNLMACGLISTQAVYEEIRAQERAKAVGTSVPPGTGLPPYDAYQKERADPKQTAR